MINIAIDGYVGSGKSTLAKGLAKKLNYKVLDTGAIYRGLACAYIARGYGEVCQESIDNFLNNCKTIEIFFKDELQHVVVCNVDYTQYLRTEEISMLAAQISPYKNLREKVKTIQQDFASKNNCIIEGRDIGTVVLPNADIKFFITASEEIRANRRFAQIKETPNSPTYENILKDLRERDYKDEHRLIAPLKPAKDSIIIDTSNMNLEQTIEYCLKIIKLKIN